VSTAQTLSTRRRPSWIAPLPDGVAHAQQPGWYRTACGRIPTEERFAYPLRTRCQECVVALGLTGEPR